MLLPLFAKSGAAGREKEGDTSRLLKVSASAGRGRKGARKGAEGPLCPDYINARPLASPGAGKKRAWK